MKVTNYGTLVVIALLNSSYINAVQLRDIFDAYDDEALIEANSEDDQIDPAQLTAEIGGDDIAREVKGATAGVGQDTTMIQLESDVEYPQHKKIKPHKRRIIDEDGDGVEDNVKKSQYELDRFRHQAFGVGVEDIHNTHNGEMPGHVRFGDSPEPNTDPWAIAREKEAAEAEKRLEKKKEIAQLKADLAASEQNIQLNSSELSQQMKETKMKQLVQTKNVKFQDQQLQSNLDQRSENEYDEEFVQTSNQNLLYNMISKMDTPESLQESNLVSMRPFKAWKITDADGDGVEDNKKMSSAQLDKFYKPLVFGVFTEDMNNTHHGNLPGELQKEWTEKQSAPNDTYSLTKRNWNRFGN